MGWLADRLPAVPALAGLASERGASLPVLAVVWPGRGTTAGRSVIRHARHDVQSPRMTWRMLMAAVMIGVDPHKGSHTAVVIGEAQLLGVNDLARLRSWAGILDVTLLPASTAISVLPSRRVVTGS
jgi:hypothetical protein